jgi:hypothetical protein
MGSDDAWGAAVPRHLREDRLARSEAKAKRLKEECRQWKSQLASKAVECDALREEVVSLMGEIDSLRRKCRRPSEKRASHDVAMRLAECEGWARKNARENAELRNRELVRDVERSGGSRGSCGCNGKVRRNAGLWQGKNPFSGRRLSRRGRWTLCRRIFDRGVVSELAAIRIQRGVDGGVGPPQSEEQST